MNLESSIKDSISKKLEDGTIEKLVAEQLEKGVVNALDNMFRSYGDITKLIEEKVKSVMVPYLENYDYSRYLVKLDSVLVEVLKNSALDNKKILSNFKALLTVEDKTKVITASKLWDRWVQYVAENVETDGLEVILEDGASYEAVEVTFEVEHDIDRDWSGFEGASMVFECEHDQKMNFIIRISRWKQSQEKGWNIHYTDCHDISSLRYLSDFEIYLMKLNQLGIMIELDTLSETDEVTPEKEPEASFS